MSLPPPFRFLAFIAGGWVVIRVSGALLLSPAPEENVLNPGVSRPATPVLADDVRPGEPILSARLDPPGRIRAILLEAPSEPFLQDRARRSDPRPIVRGGVAPSVPASPPEARIPLVPMQEPGAGQRLGTRQQRRWSADMWALAREARTSALISPALGGSQMGGRIRYRLDTSGKWHATARLYLPSDVSAADAALGVEWRPARSIPAGILLERRQALGAAGRSAFSMTGYGGITRTHGSATFEAYAQAGIVGFRELDPFVEGSAVLGMNLRGQAGVRIGSGIWGAAQPGAARLDVGPSIAVRPRTETPLTISLDWRYRVAGNAAPRSAPVITLSAGF